MRSKWKAGPYRLILDFDRITTEEAATLVVVFRRVGTMNLDVFSGKAYRAIRRTHISAFPASLTNTA